MEQEIEVLNETLEQEIEVEKDDIGFLPQGTTHITSNGVYDVKQFEEAEVNVPGIIPSGELQIIDNGTYDVTEYESASVSVPSGLTELNDGGYLFYGRARLNDKDELLSILKKPIDTRYMFYQIYNGDAYADEITNINNVDFSENTNMTYMFGGNQYASIESFPGIENMDTSNVTIMMYAFDYFGRNVPARKVTSNKVLNLSNWNVSKCTNMSYMFEYFYQNIPSQYTLTLDLSNWDTSKVTTMSYMFSACAIKNIILTNWDTSSCTNYSYMFGTLQRTGATELDLSSFTNTQGSNISNMFRYSNYITKIDMRNFEFTLSTSFTQCFGSTSSNGVPNDCLIIVKDATQKQWINTNFSRLTNVKTVAEL